MHIFDYLKYRLPVCHSVDCDLDLMCPLWYLTLGSFFLAFQVDPVLGVHFATWTAGTFLSTMTCSFAAPLASASGTYLVGGDHTGFRGCKKLFHGSPQFDLRRHLVVFSNSSDRRLIRSSVMGYLSCSSPELRPWQTGGVYCQATKATCCWANLRVSHLRQDR